MTNETTTLTYQDFINKCYLFNTLAGKGELKDGLRGELIDQANLIKEEAQEVLEATVQEPLVNILQETIDVLVVAHGMVQLLESLNCDVQGALQAVADCNLSKYTNCAETAAKSMVSLKEQGVQCGCTYNADAGFWIITDTNNKVRKPLGFTKVDLNDFVPDKYKTVKTN